MLDKLPKWLINIIFHLAIGWPWLNRILNRAIINGAVNRCPHRPHPWSTVHDYTSWTSLSDQKWSARHLKAAPERPRPDVDKLLQLFKRPEGKQRLCLKSTCLFPVFAQYLTDGFIRTKMPNKSNDESMDFLLQNTSNHQIDLCPLYGLNENQTHQLRLLSSENGKKGRLKSQDIGGAEYAPYLFEKGVIKQEFSELDPPLGLDKTSETIKEKLFAFGGDRANTTPMVAAMNTLFLREHNRLAGELEKRNPTWDDTRVFETARAITIVCFIKIVIEDYINHIMPLPFRLTADPSVAWDAPWNKPNWITTEFSLLYRWHSLIPDTFDLKNGSKPAGEIFFKNDILIQSDIAPLFLDLSAQKAGGLGAFNTTDSLMFVEKASIIQDNFCRLPPYAQYRSYVGMKEPKSFEDISTNADVVAKLKEIYSKPSDVDFYVGLFMEDTEPNSPLPPLILEMVAVDAFSQALTNPLLSKRVFNKETFTEYGMDVINKTSKIKDVLARNSKMKIENYIGFTQEDWRRI